MDSSSCKPEEKKEHNQIEVGKETEHSQIIEKLEGKALFVYGFPKTMTELELWELFEPYGELPRVLQA